MRSELPIFPRVLPTISGNLEPEGWGSRFPNLLGKLYAGVLDGADAAAALAELGDYGGITGDYGDRGLR